MIPRTTVPPKRPAPFVDPLGAALPAGSKRDGVRAVPSRQGEPEVRNAAADKVAVGLTELPAACE